MGKYSAYGAALIHDGLEVAQVRDITPPSLSLDVVDTTTHDGDGWEEVVPTILRTGVVTLALVYDPEDQDHIDLLEAMVDGDKDEFEVWFPDDAFTAWAFDAYVTGVSPTAPVEGYLGATVTLKVTGEPDLASTYSI